MGPQGSAGVGFCVLKPAIKSWFFINSKNMKQILKCLPLIGILMLFSVTTVKAETTIAKKFSGRIFLQVESKGEAWYINPTDLKRCYLGRPEDAFKIMRELAIGISNKDLDKLPVAGDEQATVDNNLLSRLLGKIVLQVEDKGQAYYIDPISKEAIYLGRPKDAFEIMRNKGMGISNENLEKVDTNPKYAVSYNPVVVSGDNNTVSNNSNNSTIINNTTNITNNSTVVNNSGDNSSTQVNNGESQTSSSSGDQTESIVIFSHVGDLESLNLTQGASSKILFAFKINSNKLIKLNGLKIYHGGTGSYGDIVNLGLYEYSSGVLLGSKVNSINSDGIISFQNLNKTVSGESILVLKGDVSGDAIGNKNHVFKVLSDSYINLSAIADISGLPIESGQVAIQSNISVNFSRSDSSPSGDILADTTSTTIAEFNVTAFGENIKINQLALVIARSGTNNASGNEFIKNGKVYVNGAQVGATKDIKIGDSNTLWENGTIFTFGSSMQIPKGQTYKIKVLADITSAGTALANGETLKVVLLNGSNNAQGVSSGITTNTNGSEGNIITVKKAVINIAKYLGFGDQALTAGSANAKIGMFILTSDLPEAFNLSSVEFKPFNYASDFGTLTLKSYKSGGSEITLCSIAANSASNFVCSLAPNLKLTGSDVISIYSNQISASPQSIGLGSYQGLVVRNIVALGAITGSSANSSGETVLQSLNIVP
jgi:hypothetical protein